MQHDDGSTETSRDWPLPDTEPTRWFLGASSAADPGTLGTRRPPRATRQRFVDRGRELDTDDVLIADPGNAHPNRLVYVSSPLRRDAHLSGTPLVALRASVDNRDAANLTAVLVDYGRPGSGAAPRMVTRGWIDVLNRLGPDFQVPIRQGREYTFRFDLQPDDYVFRAGSRIGLVVVSTDHDYTLRPNPGTELTVLPAASRLTLPLVRD